MVVYNTGKTHKPPDNIGAGQWIGVEIECYIPFEALKAKKTDNGDYGRREYSTVDARRKLSTLLERNKVPNVTLKSDGSISSPSRVKYLEIEINLLFNRADYGPLERLCKLLKQLKARTNKSCGLHVHLDCRDIGKKIDKKPI